MRFLEKVTKNVILSFHKRNFFKIQNIKDDSYVDFHEAYQLFINHLRRLYVSFIHATTEQNEKIK